MRLFFAFLLMFSLVAVASGCKKSNAPKGKDALIARGKALFTAKGCVACHSLDGSKKVGPTFKGLYGSEVTVLTNKKERKIKVDDAYLKRSIQKPQADIVKGYEKAVMVTVPVSDEEVKALIALIKSRK